MLRLLFNMSSRRGNAGSAFTLIELLTLTAMIGILAALLLAAITQGKGPAQRLQCASNVRQLGLALQEFVADNHVYPLFANVDFHRGGYPEHYEIWVEALEHEKIASKPGKSFFETGVWHCPSARRPSTFPTNAVYMSYGYNAYGLDVIGNPVSLGLGGHKTGIFAQTLAPPVNESEVAAPSRYDGDWRRIQWRGFILARCQQWPARKMHIYGIKEKTTWFFATATLNRRH